MQEENSELQPTAMVVYKITSCLNGMIYIGKTTRPLKERIGEHCRQKNTSLIDRAIQKHGIENFIVEIIEKCETPEQLNEREIFWIAELKCKHPFGYNQTDGGDGLTGCTDAARAKLSAKQTEIANRPGESERRSQWMTDYYARPGSLEKKSAEQKKRFERPEERDKISIANTGRKQKALSKMKLSPMRKEKVAYPVLEAEIEKRQITRRGLAQLVGVSHTMIIKRLRGEQKMDLETAIKIREVLAIEMPIEELFRMEDGITPDLTPPPCPELFKRTD